MRAGQLGLIRRARSVLTCLPFWAGQRKAGPRRGRERGVWRAKGESQIKSLGGRVIEFEGQAGPGARVRLQGRRVETGPWTGARQRRPADRSCLPLGSACLWAPVGRRRPSLQEASGWSFACPNLWSWNGTASGSAFGVSSRVPAFLSSPQCRRVHSRQEPPQSPASVL